MKANFYRVEIEDPSISFEEVLGKISSLPDDETRTLGIRGFPVRLQQVSQTPEFWKGDLIRIRMNDIPTKASLSGDTEPIDLDDDEGLGEETAFIYHVPTKVLVIQRNRHGVSSSTFAKYCKEICNLQTRITCQPILRGDVISRLSRMNVVRKFELNVAGLDKADILRDKNLGVEQVLNIRETFQAPDVSITVSIGKRKGKTLENIIDTATRFLGYADDDTVNVKKIKVSGANDDDDETDEIDLLEYWIKDSIDISPKDPRSVTYSERLEALEKAYSKHQEELNKFF